MRRQSVGGMAEAAAAEANAAGRAAHNRRVAALWPMHVAADNTVLSGKARRDAAVLRVQLSQTSAAALREHLHRHWNLACGTWSVGDGASKTRIIQGVSTYGNLQNPIDVALQARSTLLIERGHHLEWVKTYAPGFAKLCEEGQLLAQKLCAIRKWRSRVVLTSARLPSILALLRASAIPPRSPASASRLHSLPHTLPHHTRLPRFCPAPPNTHVSPSPPSRVCLLMQSQDAVFILCAHRARGQG